MKLTKETLRRLIKEELEEMMHNQGQMSRQEKLEKIVDLIMNDDIGLVDYPGSPDARRRLEYYGRQAGFNLDMSDDVEDLRNSLIMSGVDDERYDRVVQFLSSVAQGYDDDDYYQ